MTTIAQCSTAQCSITTEIQTARTEIAEIAEIEALLGGRMGAREVDLTSQALFPRFLLATASLDWRRQGMEPRAHQ